MLYVLREIRQPNVQTCEPVDFHMYETKIATTTTKNKWNRSTDQVQVQWVGSRWYVWLARRPNSSEPLMHNSTHINDDPFYVTFTPHSFIAAKRRSKKNCNLRCDCKSGIFLYDFLWGWVWKLVRLLYVPLSSVFNLRLRITLEVFCFRVVWK